MRLGITLLLTLLTAGCAALEAIDMLNPPLSGLPVDAELTIGSKTETIDTTVGGSTSNQVATKIENVYKTDPFILILLMLMAGWAIPSPGEMWRGFLKLFPWSKD
jgi:hypothetical protein